MSVPIEYVELSVPDALAPFARRILVTTLSAPGSITIPARPTGYCYVGWVPEGRATARANDQSFEIDKTQAHFSGQITTFDAEYSLIGPARHYLAECTPTGAQRLMRRDLNLLLNRIDYAPPPVLSSDQDDAFLDYLLSLAKDAPSEDKMIAQAVAMIEQANGSIPVSTVAKSLGLADRQLHRQFSKTVGMSPKAFAMVRRIIFALGRLAETPLPPLADVAAEAGFTDQAHMTKYFGRFMGTTPAKVELDEDGVLRTIVARA